MVTEYIALSEVVKEVIWLRGLVGNLEVDQAALTVFCERVIYLAKNFVHSANMKHIDVRYYHLRGDVENGIVLHVKVDTPVNLAGMLTKMVLRMKFEYCLDLIQISHC